MGIMAKNTTAILRKLRLLMKNSTYVSPQINAYIVPSSDAHMGEYIAECDERRAYVSGFTGSAGTAVITNTECALWTDGRYFLQARDQMDDNWILMKDGLPDTPSQGEWLCKVLPPNGRVGVDASLMSTDQWKPLKSKLHNDGHVLVSVASNLIDIVWEDRPPHPCSPLMTLPVKYSGLAWQEKISLMREKMESKECSSLILSALDDIAWLFNMRASDIQFNPVFFSYAIITENDVLLFLEQSRLTPEVKNHLELGVIGAKVPVTVHPYNSITEHIGSISSSDSRKIWIPSKTTSYALTSLVPKKQQFKDTSPVCEMKAVKNKAEIAGMKNAHIKDAVALCEYFCWLEKTVATGTISEITGADKLEKYRAEQEDYVSLSFDTISSVGSNAAIIHYRPAESTNKFLTTEDIYLCDSGAQFKDGTTDVTRTMHFGTPSKHQQECFTRVLKGNIALSKVVFPNNVKGHRLDSLARLPLWEAGLDYLHGTGHGVGSFLNVHEGPCGIGYRTRPDEVVLKKHMVLSNEPGYYEDGNFGIRIENLCLVVEAKAKHNFKDIGFLTWEPLTLVPIQTKMILPELLSADEVDWLNAYHVECREIVGERLQAQGRTEAYQWLLKETAPLG